MEFKDRCKLATDILPVAPYRTALEKLHAEMLAEFDALRACLAEAAANEREACAKAAEGYVDCNADRDWVRGSLYDVLRADVANVIRKRGQT